MPPKARYNRDSLWLLHFLGNHVPYLGILFVLVIAITIINIPLPPQWLMGWDNINPELNLWLNIQRALVSVWQEYQGVGLLAGMGHAADIPRLLLFIPLSYIVPLSFLRSVWIFAMLFMGVAGVYMFLKHILVPSLFPSFSVPLRNATALLGGLFALTNLATLQMFHTPFEPFVTHFGFLPWLLFFAIRIIQQAGRKNILCFMLLSFFSAPQGYVQTVFAVYLLALGAVSLVHLFPFKKEKVGRIIWIWVITFIMNAFWLLPSIYFLTHNVSVTVNAKINQMSTEEVYLRNKSVGTILDTAQLKGYWLDTFDFDPNKRSIAPIFGFWRQYADTALVSSVLLVLFAIVFIGWLTCLIRKKHGWLALLFLFCFTVLTMSTPPFSWINDALNHIPFWHQAYRIRFTKFSLLASISYSLLFAIGCAQLWMFFTKKTRLAKGLLAGLLCMSMLIVSRPAFLGQLLYPVVSVTIPDDYEQLSRFLKTKTPGRIANLPQHSYWGWQYTSWGYTGWGYLWYILENPILDRAFDVWSQANENYYWELSRTIYAKEAPAFDAVLAKYDVRYILLDEHIISPNNNRALYIEEIKELLRKIPTMQPSAVFGKMTVYERTNAESQSFVTLKQPLPTVSPPYKWTDNDVSYRDIGNYVSSSDKRQGTSDKAYDYPFRSLFTKRSVNEREFTVNQSADTITLSSADASDSASIDKRTALVFEATPSGELAAAAVIPCGLLANGTTSASEESEGYLRFQSKNQRNCLSFGAPELTHDNGYLITVESRHITGRPLLFSLINETAKHVELETYLDNPNLESRITNPENRWQTDYFILPPLAPDGLGYSVYISNDAIGSDETINDIKSVRFYKLPYNDMVHFRTVESGVSSDNGTNQQLNNAVTVSHPNPAYYRISLESRSSNRQSRTLILNQAFHEGWKAYTIECRDSSFECRVKTLLPFLFGTGIKDHVMVNNWANAWIVGNEIGDSRLEIGDNTSSARIPNLESRTSTIVIFFTPQLLEWMGFLLIPIPFIFLLKKKS